MSSAQRPASQRPGRPLRGRGSGARAAGGLLLFSALALLAVVCCSLFSLPARSSRERPEVGSERRCWMRSRRAHTARRLEFCAVCGVTCALTTGSGPARRRIRARQARLSSQEVLAEAAQGNWRTVAGNRAQTTTSGTIRAQAAYRYRRNALSPPCAAEPLSLSKMHASWGHRPPTASECLCARSA